jgi:hypothetical protein
LIGREGSCLIIKGGLYHQILYRDNVESIDEGRKGIEWRPLFTLNGEEISEEDFIEIHDDLLRRFHDYFCWIETYNPYLKEFSRGFNYHGLTAICNGGLVCFGKLIDSLLDLFENAPENIILTGDYSHPNEGIPSDPSDFYHYLHKGFYEKIEIRKEELLRIFGCLKSMTDRAIISNGYILLLGI